MTSPKSTPRPSTSSINHPRAHPVNPSKLLAFVELIIANGFWGFGFVAVIWAYETWSWNQIIFYRYLLASVIGLVLVPLKKHSLKTLWEAFPVAFLLYSTLAMQTYGLNTTTATKSGFITVLYVVFVPLIEFFYRRKLSLGWLHFVLVFLALLGVALISGVHQNGGINSGDLWTLACAITAAGHIFYIGLKPIAEPFVFNLYQSFWVLALSLPLFVFDHQHGSVTYHAGLGLAALAFGGTLLAFWIMVRVQQVLSPSVASLIYLVEAPMALLFGWWFLDESLTLVQSLGAGLIMVSCLIAIRYEKI